MLSRRRRVCARENKPGADTCPDARRRVLRRAHRVPVDERARLDRRLEPGGEIPDADCAAPRPVGFRRPARGAAFVAVAVVAIQIAISAYAWQHPKMLWNDGDGRAAVCTGASTAACAWLPSFTSSTNVQPRDRP